MNGIEGMVKGGKEGLGKKKTKEEITLLGDIWGIIYLSDVYESDRQTERGQSTLPNT